VPPGIFTTDKLLENAAVALSHRNEGSGGHISGDVSSGEFACSLIWLASETHEHLEASNRLTDERLDNKLLILGSIATRWFVQLDGNILKSFLVDFGNACFELTAYFR